MSDREVIDNHILIYSFEKFFELLSEIDDRLMLKHSSIFGKNRGGLQ
ncbi:MAG: hypothetical protein V1859_01765 [archaeon]